MNNVKKRFKIYLSVLVLCIISIGVLMYKYFLDNKRDYKERLKDVNEIVIDTQKKRIKEIVDNTINNIELDQERVISTKEKEIEGILLLFDNLGKDLSTKKIVNIVQKIGNKFDENSKIRLIVWNVDKKKIEYSNDKNIDTNNIDKEDVLRYTKDNYELRKIKNIGSSKILILGVSKKDIDDKVKQISIKRIRESKLDDCGYIWINEIVNYNGGENYAKRLVNPNLKDREGEFLSTNLKDCDGRRPYLKELDDIKEKGESYNEYNFKKPNSNEIGLKLSYAKLYKKYNWIIATGVYLDDLQSYNKKYNKEFQEKFKKQEVVRMINILLLFIYAIITGGIIFNYTTMKKKIIIKEKNRLLKSHYDILSHKNDEANKIIHDIKNHLTTMYALVKEDNNNLVEYLNSVDKDIHKYGNKVITGNKIVDIVLNENMELMKKKNINFIHSIEKINLDFIENKDLVGILSNLFNNAIESVEKCNEKEVEFILYSFNNGYVIIKMVNTCEKEPVVKGGKLVTTKAKKDHHGYGVGIVESIIKKYNGDLEWEYNKENELFSILIMIPIKED